MPELPEVETVRRGLIPVIEGRRILVADIRRQNLRWPFPANMRERLTGKRVSRLRRRAKYILADLDSGETLLIHLGMSGRILISGTFENPVQPCVKHDHVVLDIEGGARIAFNDARRFGAMDLWPTHTIEQHPLLAKLGPEPLGNSFSETYLLDHLKGRNTPIKTALLDQHLIAGLGNIYVCEVLFRAKVSPQRKAGKISAVRLRPIVGIVREVLSEAIDSGGSSLRDYRQTNGKLGYFQHRFRVYGREGEACLTPCCNSKIARITQGGRSTFYCPQCQR